MYFAFIVLPHICIGKLAFQNLSYFKSTKSECVIFILYFYFVDITCGSDFVSERISNIEKKIFKMRIIIEYKEIFCTIYKYVCLLGKRRY